MTSCSARAPSGTFEETIESVEKDPNGPGINIRKDLVWHLGTRASILTDYKLPIDANSERMVFAIEAIHEKELAAAVQKSLETDTNVIKRVFGEHIIWEMKSEEETFDAPVVEHPTWSAPPPARRPWPIAAPGTA